MQFTQYFFNACCGISRILMAVTSIVRTNHHHHQLGRHIFHRTLLQTPKHVLSAVTTKTNRKSVAFGIMFLPNRCTFFFPTLGNGITNKQQINFSAVSSNGFGVCQFLLVARQPPVNRPPFIQHAWSNRCGFVIRAFIQSSFFRYLSQQLYIGNCHLSFTTHFQSKRHGGRTKVILLLRETTQWHIHCAPPFAAQFARGHGEGHHAITIFRLAFHFERNAAFF